MSLEKDVNGVQRTPRPLFSTYREMKSYLAVAECGESRPGGWCVLGSGWGIFMYMHMYSKGDGRRECVCFSVHLPYSLLHGTV